MADLMNGLVRARSVRMNQEGWTIIKDFKFFRNLSFEQESKKKKVPQITPWVGCSTIMHWRKIAYLVALATFG